MPSPSTYGQVTRSQQLGRFTLHEVSLDHGVSIGPHRHDVAQLVLMLEGGYAETLREREVWLRPGVVFFRPAHAEHANVIANDSSGILIDVNVADPRVCLPSRPTTVAPGLVDMIGADIETELRRADDYSPAVLEALLILLGCRISRLTQIPTSPPKWFYDALDILERRYMSRVTLSKLASIVEVHPMTLAAAFRRYRSSSVGDALRELRLVHAERMIAGTRDPFAEIASRCGFYDQSHLGRLFKRRFGLTPAAYRKAWKR